MNHTDTNEQNVCQQITDILQNTQRTIFNTDRQVVVSQNGHLTYNQIHVVDALTRFVNAYVNIRERIIAYETDTRKIQEKAYAEGLQAGFNHATTHDFISIETLRGMTLQEISNLLYTE